MTIKIEIEITDQVIDDIMVTALEGGINYWCDSAFPLHNDYRGCKYASDVISKDGVLELQDIDDTIAPYFLTKEKFLKGLKLFLERNKLNINNGTIDTGDIDAGDADCIIQLALFDKVIYG